MSVSSYCHFFFSSIFKLQRYKKKRLKDFFSKSKITKAKYFNFSQKTPTSGDIPKRLRRQLQKQKAVGKDYRQVIVNIALH